MESHSHSHWKSISRFLVKRGNFSAKIGSFTGIFVPGKSTERQDVDRDRRCEIFMQKQQFKLLEKHHTLFQDKFLQSKWKIDFGTLQGLKDGQDSMKE